jgi:hypothetical protein
MGQLLKKANCFPKKIKSHRVILVVGLVFTALFTITCDLPLRNTAKNSETGTLRLILPGTSPAVNKAGGNGSSRSLSDDFIRDNISYNLTFTGPGGTLTLEPPLPSELTLKIGTWTVEAKAYDTDSRLAGTGSLTINVIAGPNDPINIPMIINPRYKADYEELTDIFYIHNETELRRIGTDFAIDGTKKFHLERDIVLTQPWTPIGDYTTPFEAVFDGGGHSITIGSFTGPNVSADGYAAFLGFFGLVDNAAISNVTISYSDNSSSPTTMNFTGLNGSMSTYSDQHAGGVAGYAVNTSFENIRVSGSFSVKGNGTSSLSVGGISGWNDSGTTITKCHVQGTIAGETVNYLTVGGIAGNSMGVTINGSSFTGGISSLSFDPGTGTGGNSETGGIAGYFTGGEITACFAEGSIEAKADAPNAGGIVGRANTSAIGSVTIQNCYAAGTITSSSTGSSSYSGGIAGDLGPDDLIANCYAYANVSSGEAAGGIAGYNGGNIHWSYAAGTVKATGTTTDRKVGGIMGGNSGIGVVFACMALVSELDPGPSSSLSRVANAICAEVYPGTLIGNYSRNDIKFDNNTNPPDPGAENGDGQAMPLVDFKSPASTIYTAWSFTPTANASWKWLTGYDYPVLSWQTTPPVLP